MLQISTDTIIPFQSLPFSRRQKKNSKNSPSRMLDTYNISARCLCVIYQVLLPAVWLQKYFNAIKIKVSKNRNVILPIILEHSGIFLGKNRLKNEYSALEENKQYSSKKQCTYNKNL